MNKFDGALGDGQKAVSQDVRPGKKVYDLQDRFIAFSLRVMDVVEALPDTIIGRHIAGQLLRSGTSAPPNYAEAQGAESRRDFIHKLKICLKELKETNVWMKMVQRKPLIKSPERMTAIIQECDELIAILFKSIETARKRDKEERKGKGGSPFKGSL